MHNKWAYLVCRAVLTNMSRTEDTANFVRENLHPKIFSLRLKIFLIQPSKNVFRWPAAKLIGSPVGMIKCLCWPIVLHSCLGSTEIFRKNDYPNFCFHTTLWFVLENWQILYDHHRWLLHYHYRHKLDFFYCFSVALLYKHSFSKNVFLHRSTTERVILLGQRQSWYTKRLQCKNARGPNRRSNFVIFFSFPLRAAPSRKTTDKIFGFFVG